MDINNLFKAIEEELPEKHEELIESLEIFKATLNDTIDSLQKKIDYKIKNRNFEDSEKIFQIAKDCNKLEQKIDNIYNYSKENKFENPKYINYPELFTVIQ